MSVRRQPGDEVVVHEEHPDDGVHTARILHGESTQCGDGNYACGDANCRVWPLLEVLSSDVLAAGVHLFSVAECQMRDQSDT